MLCPFVFLFFACWEKGKLLFAGMIKVVDANVDPLNVDVVFDNPANKYPVGHYIWRVEGNTLHTAGGVTGTTTRPAAFPTSEGAEWTYQRWKRASEKPSRTKRST